MFRANDYHFSNAKLVGGETSIFGVSEEKSGRISSKVPNNGLRVAKEEKRKKAKLEEKKKEKKTKTKETFKRLACFDSL